MLLFVVHVEVSHKSNCLTHLCPVDASILTLWTGPFQQMGCLVSLILSCFIDIPEFNANSADPEASDLD